MDAYEGPAIVVLSDGTTYDVDIVVSKRSEHFRDTTREVWDGEGILAQFDGVFNALGKTARLRLPSGSTGEIVVGSAGGRPRERFEIHGSGPAPF